MGDNSNGVGSERFSEITDDPNAAAGPGNHLMLVSLESLGSNESSVSLHQLVYFS